MSDPIDIDDLLADLRNALTTAYRRGFRAGASATRDAILRAAEVSNADPVEPANVDRMASPWPATPTTWYGGGVPVAIGTRRKAPRGLVQRAIAEVLHEFPGSPIVEIESRIVERYPAIARKSVGNQLRSFEGKLYRREGKYNWFLLGQPEKETAGGLLGPTRRDLGL